MAEKEYYQILNVARDADERTIKKAYRKLAMKYHPDRNPGDNQAEEQFKLASEAYEVLSDQTKRQIYDQYGIDGLKGRGHSGFSDVGDIFSHFSDIFGDFFGGDIFGGFGGRGGGRRPNRATRGSDLREEIQLTFEDAATGLKREIAIVHTESCVGCSATGLEPGTERMVCTNCSGSGQETHSRGMFMISTTCSICRGRGYLIPNPCTRCKGTGRETIKKKVSVKIPGGVDNGTRMRITGEGEPGERGGPHGDLYLDIFLVPHEHFQREREHVICERSVSFVQAILGTTIKVPTLTGEADLKIPAGTQPGAILKLKSLGFPRLQGSGSGDQLIVLQVAIPKKLKKEQAVLLHDYAQLCDIEVDPPKKGFLKSLIDNLT